MITYAGISLLWPDIVDWIPYQFTLSTIIPELMFEVGGVRKYIVVRTQTLALYYDIIHDLINCYSKLITTQRAKRPVCNLLLERRLRYWNTQFTLEYAGTSRAPMPTELANNEAARQDAELGALAAHANDMRGGSASPASLVLTHPVTIVSDDDGSSSCEMIDLAPRLVRRPSQLNIGPKAARTSMNHNNSIV